MPEIQRSTCCSHTHGQYILGLFNWQNNSTVNKGFLKQFSPTFVKTTSTLNNLHVVGLPAFSESKPAACKPFSVCSSDLSLSDGRAFARLLSQILQDFNWCIDLLMVKPLTEPYLIQAHTAFRLKIPSNTQVVGSKQLRIPITWSWIGSLSDRSSGVISNEAG